MEGIGLVLEGGGMRGVYTAGVLEYFMEQDWYFPYVVGVSAGACNAVSYISKQRGRNKKVTIDYIGDHRYLSYRNLLRYKSIFGMDFIFNELPNKLVPFDYDTFYSSPQQFAIGTTDAHTGEPIYYTKHQLQLQTMPIVQASSSLPFVATPIHYEGRTLFDGGLVDPIPVQKSLADGNRKHVIVLTKEEGYRKTPFKQRWLAKSFYPKYDGLVDVLVNRSEIYNGTLELVRKMEEDGSAIVIRPSSKVVVGRMEKSPKKLEALHELGYEDAKRIGSRMKEWLFS
ncbi:patatin family protein [Paenibacillus sp. GCM10023248]|uniref:patatin-like phospholipase family protein n=1 Tax=Bacillales TaxID=1385 RepID=UPI002379A3A8|nr:MULTISPECIES: patatin family protein [Bacillales]MDD9267978.1 patatin family protein [Paenibacillus sp. MAHUQ-63]MDR6879650.1 putative patatin/cPLA2 family phospholipase [Bacillus sp. 3255]